MDVERLSREFIRPFSPTPSHLRLHRLSFFDHCIGAYYIPMVFLYPNEQCCKADVAEISSELKKSLSTALVRYYPLTGRIKDRFSINCNDEGALYIEARVKDKEMKSVLDSSSNQLEALFPDQLQWAEMEVGGSLLAIQVNYFDYGGMAIGVCMSHKFGDAGTLTNFVRDWAVITRNTGEAILFPDLDAGSLFPTDGLPTITEFTLDRTTICRRFSFDSTKINALKNLVSSKVQNPTRVEVVSAIIYKCAVSAFLKSNPGGGERKSILVHLANLRSRLVPPLPENTAGNIFMGYAVSPMNEVELPDLVDQMKEAFSLLCNKYVKRLRGSEWPSLISEWLKEVSEATAENQVVHGFSSLCRFSTSEVDFGWGKPTWVTLASCPFQNILLMDARDDHGIEAIISLPEKQMEIFQHDENLLTYCYHSS